MPAQGNKRLPESKKLRLCPFCNQPAYLERELKTRHMVIVHHPSGICPARTYQYCEDFDFAYEFWGKIGDAE